MAKFPKTSIGQRYGRLVATAFIERRSNGHYWSFACDCGATVCAREWDVQRGRQKSCGCLKNQQTAQRNKANAAHGMHLSQEYRVWVDMRARCRNPKHRAYPRYGGRGIKVCDRWLSFESFYADVGPRPTGNHSIDRIDNDGHYEPGNVRWATRQEQQRNFRGNRLINVDGRDVPLIEAAGLAGLRPDTFAARLRRGWDVNRALAAPLEIQHSHKRRDDNAHNSKRQPRGSS